MSQRDIAAIAKADAEYTRAVEARDAKIHALRAKDWGIARIAVEVGISHQRVSQILKRKVGK